MGWYYIPAPWEPIQHYHNERKNRSKAELALDDSFLREQWEKDSKKLCTICGEPIGYGSKAYASDTEKEGLDHAICVWKQAEERKGI